MHKFERHRTSIKWFLGPQHRSGGRLHRHFSYVKSLVKNTLVDDPRIDVEAPKTTLYWSDDAHTYAFEVAHHTSRILRDELNRTTNADFRAHLVSKIRVVGRGLEGVGVL